METEAEELEVMIQQEEVQQNLSLQDRTTIAQLRKADQTDGLFR
jgi:hypothetical protein